MLDLSKGTPDLPSFARLGEKCPLLCLFYEELRIYGLKLGKYVGAVHTV